MKLVWIIPFLVAFVSCKSRNPASSLYHETGKFVNDTNPNQWIAITREDFDKKKNDRDNHLPGIGPEVLPPNHPMTVLSNFWVKKIHELLSAQFPEQMAAVPMPNVIVYKTNEVNAYVEAQPIEIKIPIQFKQSSENESASPVYIYFVNKDGTYDIDSSRYPTYFNVQYNSKMSGRLEALAVQSKCKFTFDMSKNIYVGSDECQSKNQDQSRKIVGFRSSGLPSLVNVYSDIASIFEAEEEFVFVIAHELAHYYRAHTYESNKLSYFFTQKNINPATAPLRDPGLTVFGEKTLMAAQNLVELLMERPLLLGKIHGHLAQSVREIVSKGNDWCEENFECKKTCSEASSISSNDLFIKYVSYWKNVNDPTPVEKQELEKLKTSFVEKALTCADFIKIKPGDGFLGPTLPFLSYLLKPTDRQMALTRTKDKTVKDFILGINQGLFDLENEFMNVITEANQKKLGWYTVEQEADEIALEILSLLGLDPNAGIQMQLDFLRYAESQKNDLKGLLPKDKYRELVGLDLSECSNLIKKLQAGDSSENDPYIPIGAYFDDHHSSCYRAANLVREIKSHKFTSAKTTASDIRKGVLWKELKKTN